MGNQLRGVAVMTCLKAMLFIFNLIFWAVQLTGLLVMTAGLWVEYDLEKYLKLAPDFSSTMGYVLCGISALMVLISSFAFSCVIRGQPVLLYMYAAGLALTFVMDLGLAMSILCYQEEYTDALQDGLTHTIKNYNPEKGDLDFAQTTLHCCGVSNYTDWVRLSPQRVIPTSCCIDPNRCVTANYNDVYQRGCYDAILEYVHENVKVIMGCGIAAAVLPLFGVVISCSLATYIKNHKYDIY